MKKHSRAIKTLHVVKVKLKFVSHIHLFHRNMIEYQAFFFFVTRYSIWKYEVIHYMDFGGYGDFYCNTYIG